MKRGLTRLRVRRCSFGYGARAKTPRIPLWQSGSSVSCGADQLPPSTCARATLRQPCAAFILEAPADGVLSAVHLPHDMLARDDVLEFEVTVEPGARVSQLRKGTDRIGKIVTRGKTVSDAEEMALAIREAVCFDVAPDA